MHSKEFINKMKERLTDERDRLEEEKTAAIDSLETDDDQSRDENDEDIAEVSHDIVAQLDADIKNIHDALIRIEKGTYGICKIGSEEISESRLEVIPWTDTCTEHAQV